MSFKYSKLFFLFIIVIILFGLNVRKYQSRQEEVVPVWSNQDFEYYEGYLEKPNFWDCLTIDNIFYKFTKIKIKVPITYLKKEIPLLAYYTPPELQNPTQTIYKPELNNDKVIQLKFNLSKEDNFEIKEITEQQYRDINMTSSKLIYIYHTHTSETYIDDPRNQDNNGHVLPGNIGNVAKVGSELANVLAKKYKFQVVHTTKVHDSKYAESYLNSRQTVKNYISDNPKVEMVLDIHRDGIKEATKDFVTTIINGKRVAKIMIVVTNGRFEFAHLNLPGHQWDYNLAFAKKMAAKMEELYPGLLQRIEIRDTTYNQDLHPQALLLEIGDYRNTTQEALRSAGLLADVIAEMFSER